MHRFKKQWKKQTGFTYLWVLLLVALMGVSMTTAIEWNALATQRDQENELRFIGKQFRSAIQSYYETQLVNGQHQYPSSLETLLQDYRLPGVKRHLRKIFIDPIIGKAQWGFIMVDGRIAGVHSLSEKTPIKQKFPSEEIYLQGKQRYSEWMFTYPADLILRVGVE